jgi:hypothetical protein
MHALLYLLKACSEMTYRNHLQLEDIEHFITTPQTSETNGTNLTMCPIHPKGRRHATRLPFDPMNCSYRLQVQAAQDVQANYISWDKSKEPIGPTGTYCAI